MDLQNLFAHPLQSQNMHLIGPSNAQVYDYVSLNAPR